MVFLAAVPVAGVAFVLALFLKEVPLRDTSRHGAADVGGGFGMPGAAGEPASSCRRRSPGCSAAKGAAAMAADPRQRRHRRSTSPTAGASGSSTSGPSSTGTPASRRSPACTGCPARCCSPAFQQARDAGYLTGEIDHLRLTDAGQREVDTFIAAMRAWLAEELADWGAGDEVLSDALAGIARDIIDEEPQLGAGPPELEQAQPS